LNGLIIFTKNPKLGKVKTRIAQEAGDKETLKIYLELCAITQKAIKNVDCQKFVFYSDLIEYDDEWSGSFQKKLQVGDDLGTRMLNAFKEIIVPASKLVVIGTDCPYLKGSTIENAFLTLDDSDVVIGPSQDGGYYLMGMKTVYPELFKNIPWSTDQVFQITIDRCEKLGLSVGLLEILSDIDYLEDWKNYLKVKDLS